MFSGHLLNLEDVSFKFRFDVSSETTRRVKNESKGHSPWPYLFGLVLDTKFLQAGFVRVVHIICKVKRPDKTVKLEHVKQLEN